MKATITATLSVILLLTVSTLHAQSEVTYKGLFGSYTFRQFKAWQDSTSCKESDLIRGVSTMQNSRKVNAGEQIFTKKMKIFPVLIHCISQQNAVTDYNGFLGVMEGGAAIYLLVNQQELKKVKKMLPDTDIICASPKRSIKGNATLARFLVEMDKLDSDVAQYLKKNSLVLLKAFGKDIEMCGEPVTVPVRL